MPYFIQEALVVILRLFCVYTNWTTYTQKVKVIIYAHAIIGTIYKVRSYSYLLTALYCTYYCGVITGLLMCAKEPFVGIEMELLSSLLYHIIGSS